MNILISLLLFFATAFLIVMALRFGLKHVQKLDEYFLSKNNSNYPGYQLYYRIPFAIGIVTEFFYATVLSYECYFKRNWWPLKTASFISVFLFFAVLKNRPAVFHYFSLDLVKENGVSALFTSGGFVILLNIIVLLFLALFVMLCIESIMMHGFYAPIRILAYGLLSFLMAVLTLIVLSSALVLVLIYFALKLLKFMFSSHHNRQTYAFGLGRNFSSLRKRYSEFKVELPAWEHNLADEELFVDNQTAERIELKKPTFTRRKVRTKTHNVPGLHPDKN